jgi:hypothetical protein
MSCPLNHKRNDDAAAPAARERIEKLRVEKEPSNRISRNRYQPIMRRIWAVREQERKTGLVVEGHRSSSDFRCGVVVVLCDKSL